MARRTCARRWDLSAAALIRPGMCGAIGIEAASNPATTLLAATLGYTMWWGSELGFWVWLILAWALWLGLVGLSRPAIRLLERRWRAHRRGAAPPVPGPRLLTSPPSALVGWGAR